MHTATRPAATPHAIRENRSEPRPLSRHPAWKPVVAAALVAGGAVFLALDRSQFIATHQAAVSAALDGAVRQRDDGRLGALLRSGATPNPAVRPSPLLQALGGGQVSAEVVRVLLENGADPNASGPLGETPLMVAAARGQPRVVELLLAAGARCDREIAGVPAWARVGPKAGSALALVQP